MSISDQELEHRLRDQRTRVDYVAPPASDLAELTRQRHRTLRRRELGLAGAVLAAALVFLGVPVVAGTLAGGDRDQAAQPSTSTVDTDADRFYGAPARGGLADDQEWLDALAARSWDATDSDVRDPGMELAVAPVDTHQVAYAEDVPSGRVALVLGISGQEVVHTWWVGPIGATPDEMSLADYPVYIGGHAMALIDGAPDTDQFTLVVVARPGDVVQRDLVPVVDSHGVVVRDSEVLPLSDGIAVVSVDRRWAQADPTVYLREGSGLNGVPVSRSPRAQLDDAEGVVAADPRGQATNPTVRDWMNANVGHLLRRYGLTAAEARPTLLASGGISTTDSAVLVGMTFPSGATGLWLMAYETDHTQVTTSITEMDFRPAGADLLEQVIAVRSLAGFMVSAPSGVRADVLDADGTLVGSLPLTNGAGGGMLPQPYDARTVRIVDAGGDVVGEAQVRDAG